MILFNALKHHKEYIKTVILDHKTDLGNLHKLLLTLGNSQMDLYVGILSVDQIKEEIIDIIRYLGLDEYELYCNWLEEGNGYQQLKLSDTSVWVFRLGNERNKFVHIHPARYSPHTIRVKANTLKTAIYLKVKGIENLQDIEIDSLNLLRKELDLSSIKSIRVASSLQSILTLL